jgi:hypothetical protein
MEMRKLHIVQGDSVVDKRNLEKSAHKRIPTQSWIVPKFAVAGDDVVIYIGGYGFFATAHITSEREPRSDWKNRYGASLAHVRLINPPISLSAIRRHIPKLTWAIYPRVLRHQRRRLRLGSVHLFSIGEELASRIWT